MFLDFCDDFIESDTVHLHTDPVQAHGLEPNIRRGILNSCRQGVSRPSTTIWCFRPLGRLRRLRLPGAEFALGVHAAPDPAVHSLMLITITLQSRTNDSPLFCLRRLGQRTDRAAARGIV